ncbi:MAG: hypothetical protein RLZZ360_726 [Candidatus Parcubacteria bacterium]|jgi:hypothetical protein
MLRLFFLVALLALPTSAFAYTVTSHEVVTPYEVLPLELDLENRQIITGELNGYPEMVEFTVSEELPLSVSVFGLPGSTTPDFGGIIVRVVEPRGVEEIARMKASVASWEAVKEPISKLTFLVGPEYFGTVASGTYRVEVSTPENYGKYLLVIGDNDADAGYGATWRSVSALYTFAEVTKLGMIRTALVYIPLGIILVICGMVYTVRRTQPEFFRISNYLKK